jgi:hypothetical protein
MEVECQMQGWEKCDLEIWGRRSFRSDLAALPTFAGRVAV